MGSNRLVELVVQAFRQVGELAFFELIGKLKPPQTPAPAQYRDIVIRQPGIAERKNFEERQIRCWSDAFQRKRRTETAQVAGQVKFIQAGELSDAIDALQLGKIRNSQRR